MAIFFKDELGRDIRPSPLGYDITGYTITIYIRKPDTTNLTKSGTIVDATTGQVKYASTSGDLSLVGEYFTQVKAVSGGTTKYGPIESFYVEDRLV